MVIHACQIPARQQICGKSVDDFISQAQDRTRNAHAKSMAAAYNVWKELLQADQVNFESERISRHVCSLGSPHSCSFDAFFRF